MKRLALLAVMTTSACWTSTASAQAPSDANIRTSVQFPANVTAQTVQAPRGRQPAPLRDPTEPSPDVRRAIEESQAVRKPAGAAAPAPGQPPSIPQFILKARLISSRSAPVAILSIDGTNYLVHPDTNLAVSGANEMEFKVLELTAQQVRIEVLRPVKKMLVLH